MGEGRGTGGRRPRAPGCSPLPGVRRARGRRSRPRRRRIPAARTTRTSVGVADVRGPGLDLPVRPVVEDLGKAPPARRRLIAVHASGSPRASESSAAGSCRGRRRRAAGTHTPRADGPRAGSRGWTRRRAGRPAPGPLCLVGEGTEGGGQPISIIGSVQEDAFEPLARPVRPRRDDGAPGGGRSGSRSRTGRSAWAGRRRRRRRRRACRPGARGSARDPRRRTTGPSPAREPAGRRRRSTGPLSRGGVRARAAVSSPLRCHPGGGRARPGRRTASVRPAGPGGGVRFG